MASGLLFSPDRSSCGWLVQTGVPWDFFSGAREMKMRTVLHWFGGGDGDPTLQKKRMVRRSLAVWLMLIAVGWFWLIPTYTSAQDKKPEETKAAAPAPAPAAAPQAPAGPKADPNGGNTGDASFAQDGGGNLFIPADPGAAPE